jgi:anaerobic selenocysteine-containing dehydrogenase
MSEQFSRRDFLKLAGVGAATTAILTGCGPASRTVKREPYMQMPEYNYNGQSTYYATTCRECAAGCGLVVRTMQGRAIKTEGNANHPLNLGKTCARGQATLHGLYNPDRVTDPMRRNARGGESTENMDWDAAIQVVADALKNNRPEEIAFLMGMAPDHLFDLVSDLAKETGINAPIRYGALGMFESRATLSKAAENLFGEASLPFFDVGGAQVVFSFGANFLETWLSPVSYTRGFTGLREGVTKQRGTLVQFEARMSATGGKADEWIPLRPGTESLVALAIGRLAAELKGGPMPRAFSGVNPLDAVHAGFELETLQHLAEMFANSTGVLAIPGGAALGQSNGLEVAEAVLALNALADNFGKPGGVYLSALAPNQTEDHRPASSKEMREFVQKMTDGRIKALFVHGVNPLFELPKSIDFKGALSGVEQVISFATFPDESAREADYVFPDHHGLESWGYQRVATGTAQPVLSGAQPVVSPYYNTRATADVLIAAAQLAGGRFAQALPYADEVEFLQSKVTSLMGEADGFFTAPDPLTFMAYFQQHGGWWRTSDARGVSDAEGVLNRNLSSGTAEFAGEGEFFFVPFVSPTLAEAGANKPWLQELPDPTTTVMWNTWLEMNPKTAHELHIENDDVVRVVSEAGAVELPVYLYPAIRPDTVAMPFGQGHTAYGRYAEGRGVNPADLLGQHFNEAGDLAFAGMKVRIEKTGDKKQLSRLESMMGVYGEGMGEEH